MFLKFKNKKLQEKAVADTSDKVTPIATSPSPDEPEDPHSTDFMLGLGSLKLQADDCPMDLDLIRPHLDDIQLKIHEREELLEMHANYMEPVDELSPDTVNDTVVNAHDAHVELIVSANAMTVFLYILPPVGDGAEVTMESLVCALHDHGIIYGLDTNRLTHIADTKDYNTIHTVARGTIPVHGINGQVNDHFSRDPKLHFDEDETGSVDLKSLHLFQNIYIGNVICDIVHPTPGTDGRDVKGNVIAARPGALPPIPHGKNTALSNDESTLIASIDGVLSFVNGTFRVEPQLIIPANVDISIGNLDFNGDVVVQGDVCKGFKVHANGNILVCGMAEAATLIADGNIQIKKGMNGSGDGTLTSGGDVFSHFLEQTTVIASGNVHSDTIVNCHVVSGGSILATGGMGSIIAGSLCAANNVIAKRIGNLSNIKTTIKIGYSSKKDEDLDALDLELTNAQETLKKITQSISFLKALPSITDDKKDIYNSLMVQKEMYEQLVTDTLEKLTHLEGQEQNYSECYVQSDIIYAITKVSLFNSSIVVNDSISKCKIYYHDSALIIGTF